MITVRKAESSTPRVEPSEGQLGLPLGETPADDDALLGGLKARFSPSLEVEDAQILEPTAFAESNENDAGHSYATLHGSAAGDVDEPAHPDSFKPLVSEPRKGRISTLMAKLSKPKPKGAPESIEPAPQAKTDKPKKARRVKPAKPAKATKAATPRKAPDQTPAIMVELDTGTRLAWRVSETGLEPVEPDEVHSAVFATRHEQRFRTEAVLATKAARNMALAELAEDIRIINGTKDFRTVYAMTAARVQDLSFSALSALYALDTLTTQDSTVPEGGAAVVGFMLQAETGDSLVVLYYRSESGDIDAPQVSINPDDLNFTLTQFAAARRISLSAVPVVLYDNKEFLRHYAEFAAYPSEGTILGVPLSTALRGMGLGTTALAVAAVAAAGYLYTEQTLLKSKSRELASQSEMVSRNIGALITESLPSFARQASLNTEELIARAFSLYVPTSRIVLSATPESSAYRVVMPLTQNVRFLNRPSVARAKTENDVQLLLDASAPDNCEKSTPAINNALNEVEITFTCQGADPSFNRYRGG